MANRTTLKIGGRIRLLRVRAGALKQRERELREGIEDASWTADTIERIRQDPVVTIDRIDRFGQPWFNYKFARTDGVIEKHTLAVTDDDSWAPA